MLIDGPLTPHDVPQLWERARGLMEGGADVIVCDIRAGAVADASTVDALARLQLTARRSGCRVVLRKPSTRLRKLLALVGLNDVLPTWGSLLLEAGRQTEEREQAGGVEERVDPGDTTV